MEWALGVIAGLVLVRCCGTAANRGDHHGTSTCGRSLVRRIGRGVRVGTKELLQKAGPYPSNPRDQASLRWAYTMPLLADSPPLHSTRQVYLLHQPRNSWVNELDDSDGGNQSCTRYMLERDGCEALGSPESCPHLSTGFDDGRVQWWPVLLLWTTGDPAAEF